jgi:hypothetical protein
MMEAMKEFLATHTVEAVAIIIAAITAVGVFVGPWFASWRQRKNTEQDKKLRAHFEELKRETELIISSASNLAPMSGDWKIVVSEGSYGGNISNIEEAQVSSSLEAHFPEQAKQLSTFKQKTREHNANWEDFRRKIKIAFESKGVPVVQNDQSEPSTYIYENAFEPLFNMWRELAQNKGPWLDFQKIESEPVKGGYLLYASGWRGNAVAFAKTKDGIEKCKLAFAEIADTKENQREDARILNSANKLIGEAKEFAHQLASELSEVDKFWPGTRINKFKRLKKTYPICKELL